MSGPNDYLLANSSAASMEAYERFMSSHVLQIKASRDEYQLRAAHEEVHHAAARGVRSAVPVA